ncbi:MarR family winged helix-turn-helix transcriptional regulator [Caulobacter sp. 17J80-11]|uniref:MarR family winged helix-turn-helix transcriptional regulator n=1 Tax=Caulobacter sp. 17J80-11 TaxID=2763502 RepID=UPI001653B1EC|nr:MarR family winged helix-turn-helix transcriptional regulator [Caulobacter sp. 17J80-11]MBC6983170.1 winged helix-turn-helix transcriptional regulator [Caulobacter sp. 17J80-11]
MAKAKKKSAKGSEGPLDGSPSHLLHRVLQIALDVYGEEAGPDGVTQRQFAVLTAVSADEGLTQTDLVKATGIDRSTLADLVARMIGKGLLARERSNADARANVVRLTDAGREALEAARPRVEAADARILALLPRGKREAFLNVLSLMAKAGEAAAEIVPANDPEVEPGKKAKKAKKAAKKSAKDSGETEKRRKPKAEKPVKTPKPDKKKKKAA